MSLSRYGGAPRNEGRDGPPCERRGGRIKLLVLFFSFFRFSELRLDIAMSPTVSPIAAVGDASYSLLYGVHSARTMPTHIMITTPKDGSSLSNNAPKE